MSRDELSFDYEHVVVPDADERLARAFRIILESTEEPPVPNED